MSRTDAQKNATALFEAKTYDKFMLRVFKGERDKYHNFAEKNGYTSLNKFVISAINCKMNCAELEGINGINAANYIESNYYTVEQYSDFHNVRPSYIRKLINRGLVKGAINIATVNFVPKDTPSPNGILPKYF